MNILYITQCSFYEGISHAGGMTVNYYVKQMAKKHDVRVVSFCDISEKDTMLKDKPNIMKYLILRNEDNKKEFFGKIISIPSKLNILSDKCGFSKYASLLLLKKLKEVSKEFTPDLVIMEWTGITLHIKEIRGIFRHASFVASEHDVTFLGKHREETLSKGFARSLKRIIANNWERHEIEALNKCDYTFAHNEKDYNLLLSKDIDKKRVGYLIPFYHKSEIPYHKSNNNILFFGYMARKENVDAVIWFIENVMNRLRDLDVRFVIVGGGVSQELRKLENEKISFTGYVDSIDSIFSEAMCFVAPLRMGAGIKVKVIEALYTGIPVLTNNVGIEGIPAKDGQDYYHCDLPEDYEHRIREMVCSDRRVNGRGLIESKFNLEKSFNQYEETLLKICNA